MSSFLSPFATAAAAPPHRVPLATAAPVSGGIGLAGSATGGGGVAHASPFPAALSAFPLPAFRPAGSGDSSGASSRSSSRAGNRSPSRSDLHNTPGTGTAAAAVSSLSFPTPAFGSLSSPSVSTTSSGSGAASPFPLPFPSSASGSVSQGGGSMLMGASGGFGGGVSAGGSAPSSNLSSFPASTYGSFPTSRASSSFPGSLAASRAASHSASPLPRDPRVMSVQPLAADVLANRALSTASSAAASGSASSVLRPGEGGLKLSLSLPSSHGESPIPSPKPFVGGMGTGTAPTPGTYSPLLAAKHPSSLHHVHSLPHTPLSANQQNLHVSLSSADSSRNTPIGSTRSGGSAAVASDPTLFAVSPAAPAVARAPRFPPSLRAPSCSIIGQMLAPPAPVAAAPPPAFFVGPVIKDAVKPAEPPPTDVDAVARLLASESFSLSSLIQSAGQSSGIPVFEFDAHPSPDDLTRIRLQKAGAPARGLTTDAPSLESREQKKAATKQPKPLSKAKLAKLKEEEEMRYLMGDTSAVGGWNSATRSAIGGAMQLSTASVGAGAGSVIADSAAAHAAPAASSDLISLTQAISRSRLFTELFKRISAQKLGVLDELTKGAQVASWLLQQLVRAPREKERQKQQTGTVEDVSAGSSSAASSASSSSSAAPTSSAPSPAEEPIAVKLSLPSSSTAPVVPLAQFTSLQESLLRTRLVSAEAMLALAGSSMSESVRSLYALKRSAFAAGRSMLAHAANPSSAPLELLTPTAFPSYVRPLSTLNVLVVSAPASGASTLLAQMLYLQGRLPFSLVKTRGVPPEYWETFYQPQANVYAAEAAASTAFTTATATSPALTPATSAFIAAHSKMHARNARRYNFQRYRHCVYTDRYRLRLMDSLPGDDLPSSSSVATSSSSSAHVSRTVSTALSADFVLLVVDGSRVGSFITTPRMQQQLLLAYQVGVRCVVICVTRMDSAHATSAASAASIWSQHKFDSIVAAVTSSCLKPLGFTAAHTLSIPVSGRSGENIVTRSSPELSSWYSGPTLMQLLDRVTMPVARQPETLTAQRLVARIAEPPQIKYSMLNDEVVESVRLRVQVLSGAVLHADPVALMQLDSGSESIPLGPLHTSILEREQQQDERDLLVYEDDVLEEAGAASTGAAASASASAGGSNPASAAAAAASAATAVSKHKLSADGRKLTNAERKAALAEDKKAHARQAAKLHASKNQKQDWKDEQAYWLEASEAADKEAQQGDDASMDAQTKQDDAAAAPSPSAAAASPTSSFLYSSPSVFLSTSVSPCPALVCGDVGFVSVSSMPLPSTNRDDALDTLLSGRNWAESIVSHSKEVLDFVAKHARVGDLLTAPLSASADAAAQCPKLASAFRCELVALLAWDCELHIKAGDTLHAVPWQSGGGSEQQEGADPSPEAAAASPVSVTVSRLVSVLNKANRAVLRKKPDFLAGPPKVGAAASAGTDSAPITSSPEVSVVEFACAQPMLMDTLTNGGTRLATLMIMHQQTCIAIASVTHVIT